jgi:3-dehydroquinate synthase
VNNSLRSVKVDLGERSYSILIGYGILPRCVAGLGRFPLEKEAFVISDDIVYGLHGAGLEKLLAGAGCRTHNFIMPAGEEAKSWPQAGAVLQRMLEENLGRKAFVVAVGGGVVGDLAGFAAALYRRGIPLFQVPTTLLAQVDSSVGGKVAVNHALGKNMIGTFYQPLEVWADLSALETLPLREWRAGLAEVAKYAVIWDGELYRFLEDHAREILDRDPRVVPEVIERCCRIKAEVVSRDEREEGLRSILNFGHTIGHALESATQYKKYRHGEAVAVGMVGACLLAQAMGVLPGEEAVMRVKRLLREWGLPVALPDELLEPAASHLVYDKKIVGKEAVFVLPRSIGQVTVEKGVPWELVRQSLKRLTKE